MSSKKRNEKVTITSMNTKKVLSTLALGTALVVSGLYYNYEYQGELWCPAYVHEEDLIVGEDGEYYYYFEPGRHTIEIYRNDLFPRKINNVDGYEIKSVEVNGWRHNNVVIYVNTKPVMVKLTGSNEVFSYFDEFGTVIEDDEYQKILEKK